MRLKLVDTAFGNGMRWNILEKVIKEGNLYKGAELGVWKAVKEIICVIV